MSLSKKRETSYDFISIIQPNQKLHINKSKISLLKQKHIKNKQDNLLSIHKETPLCIFRRCCGSYTVEAAAVLPVFLCCMISILFFFRVLMVQVGVQHALDDTARKLALYQKVAEDSDEIQQTKILGTAILLCGKNLVANQTPTQYIMGGLAGIRYGDSELEKQYINLMVEYSMKLPLGIFGTHILEIQQNSSSRKWIGWDFKEGGNAEGYVYITKYGAAYHDTLRCTYLKPSIQAIGRDVVSKKRNDSGGKYRSCPSCNGSKKKDGEIVYITDYGDAYHAKLQCKGLKRTIYQILYTEADGYSPCLKCVSK